jgi:carbonic anhydrase
MLLLMEGTTDPRSAAGESGQAALERLREGNRRFLEAIGVTPDPAATTTALSLAQPYAVVLACADSRATPEIILDEKLGRLFVVRVAGNVAAQTELGSIEMAVERWDCPLVLVLGHTRCAAVAAALGIDEDGPESGRPLPAPSANVAGLLSAVRSNLGWSVGSASLDAWEEGVRVNVRQTRDSLLGSSPVLRQRALEGRVLVAGAIYRLETGQVELLVE